jgi:hypothetical protein
MRTFNPANAVVRLAAVAILTALLAVLYFVFLDASEPDASQLSYEARTGSRFLPLPSRAYHAPLVNELNVPSIRGANALWGATGRDPLGSIWFGVSGGGSAHLLQYDPQRATWHDHGGVIEQLKAAGLYRDGESQTKIHSKIIPADDGWLYFASTDEDGENAASGTPPRWGGHLWRFHPRLLRWQHLMAVPEGLVAASGVGRYIYALGYFGHVLYQYDTVTGNQKRVVVGSLAGHVSRNFLADAEGHAYVPRLRTLASGEPSAELVEYDNELRELGATRLEDYLGKGSPESNHGITGLAYLADGRMAFTTHRGRLHVITPRSGGAAKVESVGWLHPDGEAYAPSLFSFTGGSLLGGVTQRGGRYEWVVFELETRISGAFPLDTKGLRQVLLYGSIARDDAGRFYAVGWAASQGGHRPLVMQITPAAD